jgi:pyruvate formate lyase activating enzyme
MTRIGLQKTTLIDFPGRISAVAFLSGCNFRCPYCHNPSLVLGNQDEQAGSVSLGEFFAFIEKRKGVLGGIVLSGGEPLLSVEAFEIAGAARTAGLAVKVDTNGSLPDRLEKLAPDFVAIDIKTAPSRYESFGFFGGAGTAGRLGESIACVRRRGISAEFRTTAAPGIVGPEDMEEIASLLRPGDEYVLNRFRPDTTLDPAWTKVVPYPEETLEAMKAVVASHGISVRIRG